ncbi:MAG: protein translocase subunit SecDF [Luteibaculaceae bacterium]
MQNKSAIWVLTILLTLACIYQLSFSYFSGKLERQAKQVAIDQTDSLVQAKPGLSPLQIDSALIAFEDRFLKERGNDKIYPIFGYTYNEIKEKELNLGLDLRGGMSVILEVSIPELVLELSNNSKSPEFRAAYNQAVEEFKTSQDDFITVFATTWKRNANGKELAGVFHNRDNKEKFPRDASDDQIIKTLREEANAAIDYTEKILRTRIDKFGVTQPSIQKQQYSGRILVELPGIKDKDRVRKVLQSTANLEFWETKDNQEVYGVLDQLNTRLSDVLYPGFRSELEKRTQQEAEELDELVEEKVEEPSDAIDLTQDAELEENLDDLLTENTADETTFTDEERRKASPLFSVLLPAVFQDGNGNLQLASGSIVGYASVADTSYLNTMLTHRAAKDVLPKSLRLVWGSKADNGTVPLYALNVNTRDGKPKIDGGVIIDAFQDFGIRNDVEVIMVMNSEGAKAWAQMTSANIGNSVAIVLDNAVITAPVVQSEIPNGRSTITMGSGSAGEQLREAEDLANILKAGALPAPARIVDEAIVGPTLGEANISSGLRSFIIALVIILAYMLVYYSGAGIVANIALLANLLFLIGSLASLQAALTLPGIAGIVLTIGMSVDANVLIYERIKEELALGSNIKQAISEGYSKAYSSILDANITTLLTAIVLYVFGSGPIKGFATTLIIGIFTSLFSAIFITRLIFTSRLEAGRSINFSTALTKNWFNNLNYKFIEKRKVFYGISAVLVLLSIISLGTRGLNQGVDFTGGRTYTVLFDQQLNIDDIRSTLSEQFVEDGMKITPEVKTIGSVGQYKITTNFLINQSNAEADIEVEAALNAGLAALSAEYTILESRKVDPSISADIKASAILAIMFSLVIIFAYILIRFRRWQYGLSALLAMFHDVIIVLGAYSLLFTVMPFSLEIDQAFIAAILTVVGYSINDTVVVFDRIREYLGLHKRDKQIKILNDAINSTISRTVNTSLSTFVVLLTIFILGGDTIKGFVFALMIGVVVGTYSSIYIASTSMYDLGGSKLDEDAEKARAAQVEA